MTASIYPVTGAAANDSHEQALLQRIKAGDSDARQKLITGNLRQVLHSNKRYARNGTRIFDLLEAGNRGLVHALDNFEPENDGRFSVYAASCICRHIELALNPEQRPEERDNRIHARHSGKAGQPHAAMHLPAKPDSCRN